MVEKIIVNTKVRALDNIVEPKAKKDYVNDHSVLSTSSETVDGRTMTVFNMEKVQLSSDMTVTLSASQVVPPTDVTGTIRLTDEEGTALTGTVAIYINNTHWTDCTVTDGAGTFTIRFGYVGDYHIQCVYPGEQFVSGTQTNNMVYVRKQPSTITADDVVKDYSSSTTLNATLKKANVVASDETIILSLGGTNYSATTNSSGVASFTIGKLLNAGDYTGTLTYAGDQSTSECSRTITVHIEQNTTNIEVNYSKAQALPNETVTITVTLTDNNNNTIPNVPIKIYENGSFLQTINTNSNGVGTTTYTSASTGVKRLQYRFEGNTNYSAKTVNKQFVVDKQYTIIYADSSISKGYYESKTVSARLYNLNTKTNMANTTVTFNIGNVTTTATTNNEGMATYTLPTLSAGSHTLTIKYDGTSTINSYTKTVPVTVNQIGTLLTMDPVTSVQVGNGNVTALLRYDDGNAEGITEYVPLANQNVMFTVNGTTYTRATNNNGYASLDVSSLNKGIYTVEAVFPATGSYNSTRVTGELRVTGKSPINIGINDVYLYTTPSVQYVPVTVTSQGTPVQGIDVYYYTAAFGTDTVTTNSNGVAQLELQIPATEQSAQMDVSVSSTSEYEGARKIVSVTVRDYELTGQIVQVIQGAGILEWTLLYQGLPYDGETITITHPDSTTETLVTDEDGGVYLEGVRVRGDYTATYKGYTYTITF